MHQVDDQVQCKNFEIQIPAQSNALKSPVATSATLREMSNAWQNAIKMENVSCAHQTEWHEMAYKSAEQKCCRVLLGREPHGSMLSTVT